LKHNGRSGQNTGHQRSNDDDDNDDDTERTVVHNDVNYKQECFYATQLNKKRPQWAEIMCGGREINK